MGGNHLRVAPIITTGLIMLSLALAGCVDPSDVLDLPGEDDVADATGKFPTVVHGPGGTLVLGEGLDLEPVTGLLHYLGHTSGEPTLGITSKGVIFYSGIKFHQYVAGGPSQTTQFVTDVMRSRDGGKTWEDVSPRLPTGYNIPPSTGDPYVYVDPKTDRVFDFDMFPPLACAVLSWSDDEGKTWSTNPAACATPPPYDHQTLAAGKPRMTPTAGYPNVLYNCVNRITDSICARSLDGGRTFSPGTPVFAGVDPMGVGPSTPETGSGVCGGLHGHVTAAPDGTVYLPRDYCGKAYVGISRDDGLTWSAVQVSKMSLGGGPDPSVAVDAAGNAYYLFVSEAGGLYLSISRDAGKTWGESMNVGAPAVTAAHLPTIVAGDAGKIAFAYAGTENLPDGYKNKDFEKPAAERKANGPINMATWNGYISIIEDALDASPIIQTTLINDPADPLVRGYCGPGRCPGMYDFIDITLSPDGRPYAAFVDACVEKCAQPGGTYKDSQGTKQGREGAVGTLATGPKLIGEGTLSALE